jgi:hypothetical protein
MDDDTFRYTLRVPHGARHRGRCPPSTPAEQHTGRWRLGPLAKAAVLFFALAYAFYEFLMVH